MKLIIEPNKIDSKPIEMEVEFESSEEEIRFKEFLADFHANREEIFQIFLEG